MCASTALFFLAANALGVKLRLAATESRPRPHAGRPGVSFNSWLDCPRTDAACAGFLRRARYGGYTGGARRHPVGVPHEPPGLRPGRGCATPLKRPTTALEMRTDHHRADARRTAPCQATPNSVSCVGLMLPAPWPVQAAVHLHAG
jgi:hypothetical protein